MKKLTLNSSAMNIGEVLTRSQLKKVIGGADVCELYLTFNNGTAPVNQLSFTDGSGTGTANAQADCARLMTQLGASRCQYDCGHDGFSNNFYPPHP